MEVAKGIGISKPKAKSIAEDKSTLKDNKYVHFFSLWSTIKKSMLKNDINNKIKNKNHK